ncbi:MAG: NINE protein [Bacillota bacterium]|nr:NINE protein [Bacillota bacterium]
MFCRVCGLDIGDMNVCPRCRASRGFGNNYCNNCGKEVRPTDAVCTSCGQVFTHSQTSPFDTEPKSRLAAGLFGIFLGGFGVHNFYLGFTNRAVWQIIITIITCGIGSIWGFIEGILILAKEINVDSNGIPLKDF